MISDKFRGKFLYDGGWVYGGLIRDCDGKPMIHVAGYGSGAFETRYSVDEETIGQFTGEFDRNGREIYDDANGATSRRDFTARPCNDGKGRI